MRRASAWFALLAVSVAGAARADELRTPGEQVLHELRAALDAADDERSLALLREVAPLHRYPASPQEAAALLELAGAAARLPRPAVAAAALRALGRTGAPAAVAFVEPALRSLKARAGEEAVLLAAIDAAGRLRAPSLVPALLKFAQRSPDLVAAEEALVALGRFRDAPAAVRASVADKVLDVARAIGSQRARWSRLAGPALRALQRLMDRRLNTVEAFAEWWKEKR